MGWFEDQVKERRTAEQRELEDSFEKIAGVVLGRMTAGRLNDKRIVASNVIEEFQQALKRRNYNNVGDEARVELAGRRILLAEDMLINAEIMKELMKTREIEVEVAENGRIAVNMFAEHPAGYYDAILMDMRMPEMDGLTATTTIRAMGRDDAKHIPIIALTANAFDEDVQQSLQAGLNAHLSKPVEPDNLFNTLEKFIRD